MLISCSVLYFICAVCNILIGILTEGSMSGLMDECIYGVRSFVTLIFIPIWYPIACLIPKFRFGIRYVTKMVKRNRDPPRKSRGLRYVSSEKHMVLQSVETLPEDVVHRIVKHLHYRDAVNVKRSSKYLQMRFFGQTRQIGSLRPYCCQGSPKSQCTICDGQICKVSSIVATSLRIY